MKKLHDTIGEERIPLEKMSNGSLSRHYQNLNF
jgi:hypothetical protein